MTRSEIGRLGALARQGKYEAGSLGGFQQRLKAIRDQRAKAKAKTGGKGKAKAAKPTKEQQAAQVEAEQQANRDTVMAQFGAFGRETGPDLVALAGGKELPEDRANGMIQSGLAERLSTGAVVLNAAGKQLLAAANAGDAGRAKEVIDRAEAAVNDRTQAEKEKAAAAEKDKAKAEAEKKKGGGGGGKDKKETPTADEKAQAAAQQKAKTATATAATVGLKPGALDALRQAAEAGGEPDDALQALGLQDDAGDATDQGRRALSALERGDVRGYRAALQDAKARQGREAQAKERAGERDKAKAERAQAKVDRDKAKAERVAAAQARQQRMDRAQALRTLGETQKTMLEAQDSAGGVLVGRFRKKRMRTSQ